MPTRLVLAVAGAPLPGGVRRLDRPSASIRLRGSQATEDWFVERATAAGLDFVHFNGMSGERYYPEIMAPGVGAVRLRQRRRPRRLPGAGPDARAREDAQGRDVPAAGPARRIGCFATISPSAPTARGRCASPTSPTQSGIDVRSYGMGVAAGDFDNDGFVDLYRTGLDGARAAAQQRQRHVHRRDREDAATGNRGGWGVSASFVDYDRDGWLDLFVGNYLLYSLAGDIDCLAVTGQHDYCPPNSYRAAARAGCIATAATARSRTSRARALVGRRRTVRRSASRRPTSTATAGSTSTSATTACRTSSGSTRRTARSRTRRSSSGAAVNGAGNAEASMGIDAGDFDNDGDEDLFITNWLAQMNILYVNTGGGVFEDRKAAVGPRPAEPGEDRLRHRLVRLRQRLVARSARRVNGSVSIIEAQARANDPFPLKMPNQLYRNLGNGRFEDVSARAGAAVHAARRQPRRRVRRHRQRRRRGRRHRHRRRPDAPAHQQRRQPEPLARAAAGRRRRERDMLGARVSDRPRRRPAAAGAARDPMAATRRPTIRACSSGWGLRRRPSPSACSGRTARPRSGRGRRSIAGRR